MHARVAAPAAGRHPPGRYQPGRHEPRRRAGRGYSLVELMVGIGAATALVATALPGLSTPGQRVARADAVQALQTLQAAQERYRAEQGQYASDLSTLKLALDSPQRRYRLAMKVNGPDRYEASATAQGAQASDSACAQLTLQIVSGFATTGPDGRCWNR